MFYCVYLQSYCCTDLSFGRINKSLIPQETLMELLADGITLNKENVCSFMNDNLAWKKLTYNSKMEIIGIFWLNSEIGGSIDLRWLPRSLDTFHAGSNHLSSSIDLTQLPTNITTLMLYGNSFDGTINLQHLSSKLNMLHIEENKLSGSVDLEHLPQSLINFCMDNNQFFGSLNLTKLPVKMEELNLCKNNFEGEIDFSQLPVSLTFLNVCKTRLSGTLITNSSKNFYADDSNVEIIEDDIDGLI